MQVFQDALSEHFLIPLQPRQNLALQPQRHGLAQNIFVQSHTSTEQDDVWGIVANRLRETLMLIGPVWKQKPSFYWVFFLALGEGRGGLDVTGFIWID
jgi:hypothetical protein